MKSLLAFLLAIAPTAALAQQAPSGVAAYVGRYRLASAARVNAGRVYRRDFRPSLDVDVQALPQAGRLRFHVVVEGHACDLDGTVSADNRVTFDAEQTCAQHIATADFRADLNARLAAGSAELSGGELRLSTRWIAEGPVTIASRPGEVLRVRDATIVSNGRGTRQPPSGADGGT